MMDRARLKSNQKDLKQIVSFKQLDFYREWKISPGFEVLICNLVLEHIDSLGACRTYDNLLRKTWIWPYFVPPRKPSGRENSTTIRLKRPQNLTQISFFSLSFPKSDRLRDPIFNQAYRVLQPEGVFIITERHPYKQLSGSQAKFHDEKSWDEIRIPANLHMISDYLDAARQAKFELHTFREWMDPDQPGALPGLATFIFRK